MPDNFKRIFEIGLTFRHRSHSLSSKFHRDIIVHHYLVPRLSIHVRIGLHDTDVVDFHVRI